MNKKFFQGAYGLDGFSKLLLVIGVLFFISSRGTLFGVALGLIIISYALWRSLSNNKERRGQESVVFESYVRNLSNKLKKSKFKWITGNWLQGIKAYSNRIKDKKYHVIVKCPKCSQRLRLPRKKGKIIVTCTKCLTEFKIKT